MKKSIASALCCAFLVLASGVYADTKLSVPSTTLSPKPAEVPKISPTISTKIPTIAPPAADDKNKTTTPPPTTPPPTTPPTTTPPTTTTPTPPPTPVPDPTPGTWTTNGSNIIVQMAAQIDIMYNITNQTITKKINIPVDNSTMVSSTIANLTEEIKITWKSVNASGNNSIALLFKKYEKISSYALDQITVSIDKSELPNENSTLTLLHTVEHFNTSLGHSYRCAKLPNLNLTKSSDPNNVVGVLKLSNFRMQAFKEDKKASFGLAEDCALDVSDVVPIAVGLVLAGLVVIVLVAYLISRRRSQARGYLSM